MEVISVTMACVLDEVKECKLFLFMNKTTLKQKNIIRKKGSPKPKFADSLFQFS